ncbi:class I SAM-dependent DNA methyltransferase [Methylobacterium haplocladii]|uniref:Methyltransferase n=1 Tax=Methylobacterium haplocladii TaxID=1176176 RepID=A0A512ILE2_9HYPH|nr:SAM-dependent methyltransferase [Methylobacterium haplocladii]GEO98543.1 methyltransferase [Methylobacterium haplocladii]GJD85176.1 Ubiquinone biosynthesis O-methyltransferase, mitochondrial [Methylobacterium haplocladii]GLS61488.1 methyltransferase [Methylobacterium haplocladii]
MSRHPTSLSPDYFAGLYADDPDPWRFASSDYERAKYAATLAALPRPRYAAALEIGCSIGVLTRQLGGRCDALTALDVVPAVLDTARKTCADQPRIRFLQAAVPGDWPGGRYDLILLSEVAYYLDRADLERLVACVREALLPGGDVVLVHYLGATDYPLSGDEAADGFIQGAAGFAGILAQSRTAEYRLDVLRKAGAA